MPEHRSSSSCVRACSCAWACVCTSRSLSLSRSFTHWDSLSFCVLSGLFFFPYLVAFSFVSFFNFFFSFFSSTFLVVVVVVLFFLVLLCFILSRMLFLFWLVFLLPSPFHPPPPLSCLLLSPRLSPLLPHGCIVLFPSTSLFPSSLFSSFSFFRLNTDWATVCITSLRHIHR